MYLKTRISRDRVAFFPLTISSGLLVYLLVAIISESAGWEFSPVVAGILGFIILLAAVLSVFKLYMVSFDSNFLYVNRNGIESRIGLEKIGEIRIFPIPFNFFWVNSYLIRLYFEKNGRLRSVLFFSRAGFDHMGTVSDIPHIRQLRNAIKEKKLATLFPAG